MIILFKKAVWKTSLHQFLSSGFLDGINYWAWKILKKLMLNMVKVHLLITKCCESINVCSMEVWMIKRCLAGLNIIIFQAQTDCPVETMLHCTTWTSDRTSGKTLFEKNKDIKSLLAIWSTCTLINIKLT